MSAEASTTSTNYPNGRCRAVSQSAGRRCRNSAGHGPTGSLCSTHAHESSPVTIDSDPETLIRAVSESFPARCRAIKHDGRRCTTGCGATDRFCALHKTISLPEVVDFLDLGELDVVLIKRALSAVRETEDSDRRALTDGGAVKSSQIYPVSVRVEIDDSEVTWHASDAVYERLHNHPSGNLVDEIEAEARESDGSLFDVVVATTGAFWVTEANA